MPTRYLCPPMLAVKEIVIIDDSNQEHMIGLINAYISQDKTNKFFFNCIEENVLKSGVIKPPG